MTVILSCVRWTFLAMDYPRDAKVMLSAAPSKILVACAACDVYMKLCYLERHVSLVHVTRTSDTWERIRDEVDRVLEGHQ